MESVQSYIRVTKQAIPYIVANHVNQNYILFEP